MEGKNKYIFFLYFALKPLYLWSSGALQICDIIFMLGFGSFLVSNRFMILASQRSIELIKFLTAIVVYQIMINAIWYLVLDDVTLMKTSMYYIFNLFCFVLCLVIGENNIDELKKYIALGSFVSICVTILGMLIYTSYSRSTSFFNNPNQLGYYAIIMLTVLIYCLDYFNFVQRIIMFIGACWAIIASLSKAAIIGAFGLFIIYIFFYPRERTVKKVLLQLMLAGVILGAIYFFFFSNSSIIMNNHTLLTMRHRILYMASENDSSLGEGRGYNRVFEMGANFLWGMGEGSYGRFTVKHGTEVHSTFISILVSYGVIGFVAYISFFVKCLKQKGYFVRNLTIMSGIFLYSISHNGIRNSLMWILLAVFFLDSKDAVHEINTLE